MERYYTSAGDIYSVLKALHADRSSITIQFEESSAITASMILEVDLKSRSFRLDQFSTPDAHRRAESGQKFTLRASVNGIKVLAKDLTVQRIGRDDGGNYYDVKFPDKLLYLQRRDAFRAWVRGALMVNATINNDNRPSPIAGRILNMSATGFRLLVEGQIHPEPEMMEKFQVNTHLPLIDQDLSCEASSVYSQYQPERNQTVMGLRFVNLGRLEQLAVNRFVTQLQREAIT